MNYIPKGTKVRVIDEDSQYCGKTTTVREVCGVGENLWYHLEIDGEENDWEDYQLEQV